MQNEPLVTRAGIISAVGAILGLFVAFGLKLDADQEKAILGVAVIAAPLIVAALTRSKVTPYLKPAPPVE